jgi:two-component system OmpR family response regulator
MSLSTRVLVVDDEERFRTTLVKLLKAEGIDAQAIGDAAAALDILADWDCDVVLLDVKMPGIDGIEALKRIKALGCDVEVIILTGHASLDNAVEIMKYGAFDFLLKPCPTQEILDKISLAHERKIDRRRV